MDAKSTCTQCGLPHKKIDGLYVCPNGHTIRIIELVADYDLKIAGMGETKKKVKWPSNYKEELVNTFSEHELAMYLSLNLFYMFLKELKIPFSFAERYIPAIYKIFTQESDVTPTDLIEYYKKMVILICFMIKRELEQKKGSLYTLYDLQRYLTNSGFYTNYYKDVDKILKKHRSELTVTTSPSDLSLTAVVQMLRDLFPDEERFKYGVIGIVNQNGLQKLCDLFGLTITPKMQNSFKLFLEYLVLFQLQTQKKVYFSEEVLGAFLLFYMITSCDPMVILGAVRIVETVNLNSTQSKVIQDFFSREHAFSSFESLNKYLVIIEKTKGSEQPFLNPLEFPAMDFGKVVTQKTKLKSAIRFLRHMRRITRCRSAKVLYLVFQVAKRFSLTVGRFTVSKFQ
ncbi:hypothetical protein NEOKW01_1405 [Nematocida sp. AWRm80]|nr:hypothetical protein NEOKW01_1405 [Nematocida sp. AWRm80]